MSTYVSEVEVEEWLTARNPSALATAGDLAAVIEDAEGDVDLAVGGVRLATGRAVDPAELTGAQAAALARATCAAVEWRLESDREDVVGAQGVIGQNLTLYRQSGRPPAPGVLEELAGHGLVRRTLVASSPPPLDAA